MSNQSDNRFYRTKAPTEAEELEKLRLLNLRLCKALIRLTRLNLSVAPNCNQERLLQLALTESAALIKEAGFL